MPLTEKKREDAEGQSTFSAMMSEPTAPTLLRQIQTEMQVEEAKMLTLQEVIDGQPRLVTELVKHFEEQGEMQSQSAGPPPPLEGTTIESLVLVTHDAEPKYHKIANLVGHCETWSTWCSFRFGGHKNVSLSAGS